nr:hypothetical protein [Corynebacterium xerosis]
MPVLGEGGGQRRQQVGLPADGLIRHRQHRRPPQIRVDGSAVAVCAAVAVIAVVAVGGGVLGSRGVGHVRHNTRRLGAAR